MGQIMCNIDIQKLFDCAYEDILCNTSYPIKPDYFSEYKTTEDIMENATELSFYFHIPFCKQLCKFCEYTRFLSGNFSEEEKYIKKLKLQTIKYLETHKVNLLYGLDIGGGTPTALNHHTFAELLRFINKILKLFRLADKFESSMEFSFSTIDEEKINLIAENGIQRLSTGLQVYDKELMYTNNRVNSSLEQMKKIFSQIRKSNIKKLNLDMMYGFENQTKIMLENTVYIIEKLRPEHVTLYEMRYNMNQQKHETINREKLFQEYSYLFEKIKALGYFGSFGQNTFSMYDDKGVSSYLRSRMYEGIPYKGFGISAQSMSRTGISYNILKSSQSKRIPDFNEIFEQDIYRLPPDEIAAKYICISLYSGQFNMKILSDLLNANAYEFYKKELDFLEKRNLIALNDNICNLTIEGFKFYGAVASLFWSEKHKRKYILINNLGR